MLAFKTSLSKKNKNLIFTKFKEALDFFFSFLFSFYSHGIFRINANAWGGGEQNFKIKR